MKAPEKLYLRKRNKLPLEVVRDEWYETDPQCMYGFVEYTRTDAFIEKACNGIEKLLSGYIITNFHFGDSYDIDRFIEDFKDHIKGG